MRVLFLTLGNQRVASSRTRVFQYLPHLARLGLECKVIKYQSGLDYLLQAHFHPRGPAGRLVLLGLLAGIRALHLAYSLSALLRFLSLAGDYDIVFIQKVLLPAWAMRALLRRNPRVVLDFDDAIYAHPSWNKERLDAMLPHMRLVILENQENQEYVSHYGVRTLVITGPIDCQRYQPARTAKAHDEVIIGWVGSTTTTEYLAPLAQPLQELSRRHPEVVLELIGAGAYDIPGVHIRRHAWSLEQEVRIMAGWDLGVMPLSDDPWTRGKGGYKLLQYMAMGMAAVCSPVGVNQEIGIAEETVLFATTPQEWLEALERLITDPELRQRLGREARRRAEQAYSYEHYAPQLARALREAAPG